jgi:hypothetical protein
MKSIESPDNNRIEQLLAIYKERFDKFKQSVKKNFSYEDHQIQKFKEIMDFLTFKKNDVPIPIPDKWDDFHSFQGIIEIFAPLNEWTEIEKRILYYITQETWYWVEGNTYYGYYENFYKWLKNEIKNDKENNLFYKVVEILREYGITEDLIAEHAAFELRESVLKEDKTPTSFGKYLLYNYDKYLSFILKDIRVSHIDLFIRYKQKEFEPHIKDIVVIDNYKGKDGEKHINGYKLKILCSIDPEKYQHLLLEQLSKIDCKSCIAMAGSILLDHCGQNYKGQVFEIVKSSLKYLLEQKNKDKEYKFNWFTSYNVDATREYIEWILQHYDKKAQEYIFEYIRNSKTRGQDIIDTAVKYLGQDAVNLVNEFEKVKMSIKKDVEKLIDEHLKNDIDISMNFRLERYGKIYEQWWLNEINKLPLEICLQELSLAGLDEDICLPIFKIVTSDRKVNEIAIGYPNKDEKGNEFDYPPNSSYFGESNAFLKWAKTAGIKEESDKFEKLCDLFKYLHDYELYSMLLRVKEYLIKRKYSMASDFVISLRHHDDQDSDSLKKREDYIKKNLENFTKKQVLTLAINAYETNERRQWLVGLKIGGEK